MRHDEAIQKGMKERWIHGKTIQCYSTVRSRPACDKHIITDKYYYIAMVLNFTAITLKTATVYASHDLHSGIVRNAERIETHVKNGTEPGDASGPMFCVLLLTSTVLRQ